MTMPLRSAPPPPSSSQTTTVHQRTMLPEPNEWIGSNFNNPKYEQRKPPPPRPPPPKITKDASSKNVFSNLFGRAKTNSNSSSIKQSSYASSQLFSLPPPPGAKPTSFVNHQPSQQQQRVELISFDSPPSSPKPIRNLTHMEQPISGLDLLSSDPPSFEFGATSSSSVASGFEDSFVSWDTSDPFSPLPSQMPTFDPRPTNITNTTNVTREIRPDFLDPLCNGKSILAPQPVVTMPTIIKPIKPAGSARTMPKTQLPSMSSGFGSGSMSEATVSSSSSVSSNFSYQSQEESYGIVQYDFEAMQDGDLNLRTNEKIYLLRKINDDWYYGRKKSGQEGMFPASYVDVKVPLRSVTEPYASSPTPSQSTPTKKARVAFDFPAQTNEDLTLRENEVVTILYAINDDWWFGEVGHRRGQFPAAFVEIL